MLVNLVCMICFFDLCEKQVLLECVDISVCDLWFGFAFVWQEDACWIVFDDGWCDVRCFDVGEVLCGEHDVGVFFAQCLELFVELRGEVWVVQDQLVFVDDDECW